MQRLKGAFRFLDLNFRMAQVHETLQKPWMYFSLGGLVLTGFWLALIVGLIFVLPSGPVLWIMIGLIVILYHLCLFVWGELTALLTAQIFAGLVRKDVDQMPDSNAGFIFSHYLWDILIYALSVPGLSLIHRVQSLFSRTAAPIQAWMSVHPLIPPVIVLQDLKLREALDRVKEILSKNLLRFQPGYLPVGWVARSIQWILIVAGFIAGLFITTRIADPLSAKSWQAFWAVGAGLVVMGVFSMVGIAFSTYFRTCYHTALYVWVLEVQSTQSGDGEGLASPPEIISKAMRRKPEREKEGSDATKT